MALFTIALVFLFISVLVVSICLQGTAPEDEYNKVPNTQNHITSRNQTPSELKRSYNPNDSDAIGKALLSLYKKDSDYDGFNGFVLFYLYLYMLNHHLNSELREELLNSAIYDCDCFLAKRYVLLDGTMWHGGEYAADYPITQELADSLSEDAGPDKSSLRNAILCGDLAAAETMATLYKKRKRELKDFWDLVVLEKSSERGIDCSAIQERFERQYGRDYHYQICMKAAEAGSGAASAEIMSSNGNITEDMFQAALSIKDPRAMYKKAMQLWGEGNHSEANRILSSYYACGHIPSLLLEGEWEEALMCGSRKAIEHFRDESTGLFKALYENVLLSNGNLLIRDEENFGYFSSL